MDVAGSIDGIRQVVNIAAANPDFAIIMQWTGGRAGAALGSGHSGNLGKYSTGLVSRAIGGKMPGGFNISSHVRRPTSPRHGVLVPNAPMPCCSLLPLWKP